MLLVKLPVPLPSVVWLLLTVGLWLVLQQTPLAVTVAFPSLVTLPPHMAVLDVVLLTVDVVTVGKVVELLSVKNRVISSLVVCDLVTVLLVVIPLLEV